MHSRIIGLQHFKGEETLQNLNVFNEDSYEDVPYFADYIQNIQKDYQWEECQWILKQFNSELVDMTMKNGLIYITFTKEALEDYLWRQFKHFKEVADNVITLDDFLSKNYELQVAVNEEYGFHVWDSGSTDNLDYWVSYIYRFVCNEQNCPNGKITYVVVGMLDYHF